MTAIYAKLDDLEQLTPAEIVDEIYNDDPDVILEVIKKNRREADDADVTNTDAVATFVERRALEADDVVDGFCQAQARHGAERGSSLRELLASIFEAGAGLEPAFESEQTLMLAFGDRRFSDVVAATALWESYSFKDLATLLCMLLDKMDEHCDDADALALIRKRASDLKTR